jgi:hypothetical protein
MAAFSPTATLGPLQNGASSAGPLQPSDAPGPVAVSIAGVTFNTSECPERFPIGAVEQMLVVKTLPGGTRIISAFGASPKPVTWSGNLYGNNITPRVRQLRLLAVSGQPVTLSWNAESYLVVVKEFTPTYQGGFAGYEITVEVSKDQNGEFTVASAVTLDQQIYALQAQADAMNAAIVAADPVGSAAMQGPLASAKAAVQAANPIAQNIVSAALTVIPLVQGAVSAVKGYAAGLSPLSNVFASAQILQSSLTSISSNIARGQSAVGVTAQGGSLFGLAAQQYGDVTQAFNLAQANGLSSPFLSSVQQTFVALPPFLGH